MTSLAATARTFFDESVDLRRLVHANPELSFEEHETTRVLRERMAALGLEAAPCPTPTGGVWVLEGGKPGRTVLLRADIDALPLQEEVDVVCRSQVDGVMHACGHDLHLAWTWATAATLARHAEDLPGRYVFLFQPGEERVEGARRMLDGGVLDGLSPDRMVTAHVGSILPAGTVAVRAELALAGVAVFTVTARGGGGHAGVPGESVGSPLVAVSRVAGDLQSTVVGLGGTLTPAVATAGRLQAGTAFNVVPTSAQLSGAIRTYAPEDEKEALRRLEELLAHVADDEGVTLDLAITASTPPVYNDPAMTDVVQAAARGVVGEAAMVALPPVAAGDDAAEFLRRVPGCYFFVGGAAPGERTQHHSPEFHIDEKALEVGAAVMAEAAVAMAQPDGTRS